MKRIITFLVISFISLNSFCQDNENEEVLKSFENYKSAILNDKGKIAADYVDSRTIKYYSDILEKVKVADSTEISSMGIIDKLTVLSIRHRSSKSELLSFNGRGLFEYAIKSGMVGKNSVMNASLGKVTTNGDFAKAEFIVNGQITPFYFHLYKEDNIWKIDITHLFSLGTMGLKKMIENSGQPENIYILDILEVLTGKKPTKEIWKPVI